MIGYMSNQESIYQLEMNVKSDPKLVGKIGLALWKGLKCNYPLDLSEETKPIILYNIFVSRDIESPDQITSQLIKSCVYGIPSEFAIRNLRKIIYLVDQHNLHGLKIFKTTIFENFSDIFETQTQIQLARDLGYLSDPSTLSLLTLCNEIERMLNSIISKLRS